MSPLVIDAHSHILVQGAEKLASRLKAHYPGDSGRDFQGEESREVNRQKIPQLRPALTEEKTKLSAMDRMGIDVSVLAASPLSYHAWAEGEDALRLSRIQNEAMAEMVARRPERFAALAVLPLQDVDLAVAELEYAVRDLGHRGAMVQTNYRGRDLDHPVYETLYARLEELDLPLFLHPHDVAGKERFQDYYLTNLIGNPLDTTIAIGRMMLGGVLQRHPKLKVCLVHAGGQYPYIRGRLDHGYRERPEARKRAPKEPSAYLGQVWFDTITHWDPALSFLIETVGEDHVYLGSDYPFDMAEFGCVEQVRRVVSSPGAQEKILGGNAAKLLKLS
ncbi:MAG: amidohydrolase family protein [Nitrospinota bacterium]